MPVCGVWRACGDGGVVRARVGGRGVGAGRCGALGGAAVRAFWPARPRVLHRMGSNRMGNRIRESNAITRSTYVCMCICARVALVPQCVPIVHVPCGPLRGLRRMPLDQQKWSRQGGGDVHAHIHGAGRLMTTYRSGYTKYDVPSWDNLRST